MTDTKTLQPNQPIDGVQFIALSTYEPTYHYAADMAHNWSNFVILEWKEEAWTFTGLEIAVPALVAFTHPVIGFNRQPLTLWFEPENDSDEWYSDKETAISVYTASQETGDFY